MGAGPGFSFSVGGPFGTLVTWTFGRGAADAFLVIFLEFYSVCLHRKPLPRLQSRSFTAIVFFPRVGSGPGFSFSVGGPFGTLVPRLTCEGSADLSLGNYSVFGSGGVWRSGKSCKYEGGELNYSRKTVVP